MNDDIIRSSNRHMPAHYLVGVMADETLDYIDGPHGEPDGVARAKRIYEGMNLFNGRLPKRWVMVTVQEIPDVDTEINQEAIDILNSAHEVIAAKDKPSIEYPDSGDTIDDAMSMSFHRVATLTTNDRGVLSLAYGLGGFYRTLEIEHFASLLTASVMRQDDNRNFDDHRKLLQHLKDAHGFGADVLVVKDAEEE